MQVNENDGVFQLTTIGSLPLKSPKRMVALQLANSNPAFRYGVVFSLSTQEVSELFCQLSAAMANTRVAFIALLLLNCTVDIIIALKYSNLLHYKTESGFARSWRRQVASHIKSAICPNRAAAATARPRKAQGAKDMQVEYMCFLLLFCVFVWNVLLCVVSSVLSVQRPPAVIVHQSPT